jgi:hypothetical protein
VYHETTYDEEVPFNPIVPLRMHCEHML